MMEMFTHYTGDGLAEFLTACGLPCSFLQMDIAPQVLTYHFDLLNIEDITRLKKPIKMLEAAIKQKIEQTDSELGHFAMILPRKKRGGFELMKSGDILGDLPNFSVLFGLDTQGKPLSATLQDLPHLLVAGTTGSGKSVAINGFIFELCAYNKPEDLGLVLIDLKQCEFNIFSNVANLITPIKTTSEQAETALEWLVSEMERRYKVMAELGIDQNNGIFKTLLVVVDELADLVLQNENCKTLLVRLLQKSRACDIHIIVATQSPRAKLLDGLMLANLPSRVCLTCANYRESMLVLGHGGAEKLTGKGDAIVKLNGTIEEKRVQIPFVSKEQIKAHIK